MNIAGVTFGKEMKGYIAIDALKISKWVNPRDLSFDVIFRLSIEHKYGRDGFKKVREFYLYFPGKDMENVTIDRHVLDLERERLKKIEENEEERRKEQDLQKEISPLKEYIPPIIKDNMTIEDDGERKRIKIDLSDYEINEKTKKRDILFSLKFRKGIDLSDDIWNYSFMVEPFLVQTLRWSDEEFMPALGSLEIWLLVPKDIYSSLSAIDVQPVGHLRQMFFFGEKITKMFRDAGQPLSQKDTLCINWNFYNVSVSSLPESMKVIHSPGTSGKEEYFVGRFKEDPESSILILRELLYMCRFQTFDFGYIISSISDENLKDVLSIFNIMIFQRYLRPMKENLKMLLSKLENFKYVPHYGEVFGRYDIFYALVTCEKSEDFFSDTLLAKIRKFQELNNLLDPDYMELMQDLITLSGTTKKFNLYVEEDKLRYGNETLSMINSLNTKWDQKLIHPDKYIFLNILSTWKDIVEKEFEEFVPKPEIEATVKTKNLALADMTGIVLSVKNRGKGEAKEVQARLLPSNDYDIIVEKSDIKPLLAGGGKFFEPELIIKPRNEERIAISYEITYKDVLGREKKNAFEEIVEFMRKEIQFQKIENPYIIGDIVRDKRMFFGREELITNIIENFKGRFQINPIFLYGQRRTGKSSVLYHLKERLKDEFSPVLFELSEISTEKSFYRDLMEKIKKELEFDDIEIPHVEDDPFDGFNDKFLAEIRRKLGDRKIVLMIDEYQRIDELIVKKRYDESVIDFLNALVQDGKIKFILAGFLQPDELQNQKWNELMRFFTTVNVSILGKEDSIRLICEPVRASMEYDGGGIEKVISLSGCHPYFTQLICYVMVEHHNRDKVNIIGYSNVIDHLFTYFERGYNVFTDIIKEQTDDIERRILFYMYNLMEKKKEICIHKSEIESDLIEKKKISNRSEIENALSHLERKEIIRKSSEHPDYYEFAIDLYRHWVKWNLSD